ncbi:SAPs pepsin-like proteinases secreted from pathogens to degrade host protein [Aspergillus parasiticus SU-1]|uniref:SAPs pepsin-like proteinases secreted from pathogens to degrade host protein n=1 Tax=Aspergillus parasiticus (strain ATCC 56775 / NRRL 5862 / SRRC 143 / SU-1) TaxID=1403190 RepID=A0A0F0I4V2_ASPPU|nr:SAPs pepsin-like proteinases secreted from pathogens to degrade host protein [Aspergillus parasiticus SU-1]
MIKFWCLALGAAYYTNALTLEKKDLPSVLEIPFESGRFAGAHHHDRRGKRDHAVKLEFYGKLKAQFSTLDDSSWVVVSDNKELAKPIEQGILDGYNASASNSSRSVKTHATVDRFDQDEVGHVDIMSDTMIVGDVKLEAMKFATLREKAAIGDTLGLGYGKGNSEFISVTQALVDTKAIQSPAFSMWMEENHDQTYVPGTILFGGVNKAKPQQVVPGQSYRIVRGNRLHHEVRIVRLFSIGAVFSSATYFIGFPQAITQDLFSQLNVTMFYDNGQPMFPCDRPPENKMLTFHFGDVAFNFSLDPFIAEAPSTTDPQQHEEGYCYLSFLTIEPERSNELGRAIIGANSFKLVYTVFDMGNDEVSLAQRRWEKAPDEIMEIKSGKDGIPDRTTQEKDKENTADKPKRQTNLQDRIWNQAMG